MSEAKVVFNLSKEDEFLRVLEQIAANGAASTGGAALDAAMQAVLDGTNTTRVWEAWYPRAAAADSTASKYSLICRFANMLASAWKDKTYTLRSYKASVSSSDAMTPMDDLADIAAAAQLCTEATDPAADWADEDPMTWYIRANALSLADGTMNITHFEGEADFDISGETAPVYTFALALWIKEWEDASYNYISFRTTRGGGFYPADEDVDPTGAKRPVTWHATFPGGLNASGGLTSGAGKAPANFMSATTGLTNARKVTAYEGLWSDNDTIYVLRQWQLRHWTLENSNICEGCTNYTAQYKVARAETGATRVLLTPEQAANFLVGSSVEVGDPGDETSHDRGNANMHDDWTNVRISSITSVEIDGTTYGALNLDTQTPCDITATCWVSTMPWWSGVTEDLPGHKDGALHSLTAGKAPIRIAGIELMHGAYDIGLEPLYDVTANAEAGYDYAVYECRNSEQQAGAITNYTDTGIRLTGKASGWEYVKEFVKTKLGVLLPKTFAGSSTGWYKSGFSGSPSAGVRCPWRFGSLSYTGNAGLACGSGNVGPTYAVWFGRPRLGGAGKKRGEWTA